MGATAAQVTRDAKEVDRLSDPIQSIGEPWFETCAADPGDWLA